MKRWNLIRDEGRGWHGLDAAVKYFYHAPHPYVDLNAKDNCGWTPFKLPPTSAILLAWAGRRCRARLTTNTALVGTLLFACCIVHLGFLCCAVGVVWSSSLCGRCCAVFIVVRSVFCGRCSAVGVVWSSSLCGRCCAVFIVVRSVFCGRCSAVGVVWSVFFGLRRCQISRLLAFLSGPTSVEDVRSY